MASFADRGGEHGTIGSLVGRGRMEGTTGSFAGRGLEDGPIFRYEDDTNDLRATALICTSHNLMGRKTSSRLRANGHLRAR